MSTAARTAILTTALSAALSAASLGAQAAPQAILVTNEAGQPVAQAAVSVYVKGTRATASANATANMAQKGRAFQPTLLVVQTGTPVLFPNFDTVRHHVYSFSPTKKFEIKLYAGTPSAPVVFDKAGTATMGCNIHDQMLGYIHVVDTPYFSVTGSDGQVNLDLPAGEHRVQIWWPALGETNPGVEQMLKAGGGQAVMLRVKS
ncbi:methylamine utilization protein [Aquabacterium sp.]|uniref:methylamine utilization protein n=1 Tax=Aquabacterium sp. TaxID=1872578 RepID=UPI00198B42C9|nr:methylamine utilization protein [Aquabacterium sp.]MBC7699976.1 methylamine utilization protein [Aquabacterium sp.]